MFAMVSPVSYPIVKKDEKVGVSEIIGFVERLQKATILSSHLDCTITYWMRHKV